MALRPSPLKDRDRVPIDSETMRQISHKVKARPDGDPGGLGY